MQCAVCGNPGTKKCSQCKAVFYCSTECQRKHWPEHKKTCATYTRACQFLNENSNAKTIEYDDFEVIKKLGDGNFTQVF